MLHRDRILQLFADIDEELGHVDIHGDLDDAWLNDGVKGFLPVDEGLDLLERFYPGRPVEAKVRFFLEELLDTPPSRREAPRQPHSRGER